MSVMSPLPNETILDVGVGDGFARGMNFLEQWYPYPENITALGDLHHGDYPTFRERFPKVNLVLGDGKSIDFPDNAFNIVFSNAVVEHVGTYENQCRFVSELCRVGRRVFLTTPNYWFPIDSHTLLPLVHYLPIGLRYKVYKIFGKEKWADINMLNLLTPSRLLNLFPDNVNVKIIYLGAMGRILAHSLICIVTKPEMPELS